ncbi:MAG TPA: ABC transporter substrate-binding protein [Stellaceae bacterium]|nr:ABC transporter substrate-binding protein [Stellaceae bacterium]
MRRRDLITLLGGAATAWPIAARAQQKRVPVIGFLVTWGSSPPKGFYKGLSETGYVEGKTVVIEVRSAAGRYDQLPALAAEFVDRKVDLIATGTDPAALAAKGATSTIPIVFLSWDPITEGLVASLARPGGNLTGASVIDAELTGKRIELLSELVPEARVFALLVNPNNPDVAPEIRNAQDAARAKGVELHVVKAGTADEIDAVFATLVRLHAGGLILGGDPFLNSRKEQLVALASHHAIPAIYDWSEFASSGGLISYAPSFDTAYRQVGMYAGRILKGEKPADLPVQQPTTVELVINLKTAKALGLSVPQSLLARADEVIE